MENFNSDVLFYLRNLIFFFRIDSLNNCFWDILFFTSVWTLCCSRNFTSFHYIHLRVPAFQLCPPSPEIISWRCCCGLWDSTLSTGNWWAAYVAYGNNHLISHLNKTETIVNLRGTENKPNTSRRLLYRMAV